MQEIMSVGPTSLLKILNHGRKKVNEHDWSHVPSRAWRNEMWLALKLRRERATKGNLGCSFQTKVLGGGADISSSAFNAAPPCSSPNYCLWCPVLWRARPSAIFPVLTATKNLIWSIPLPTSFVFLFLGWSFRKVTCYPVGQKKEKWKEREKQTKRKKKKENKESGWEWVKMITLFWKFPAVKCLFPETNTFLIRNSLAWSLLPRAGSM